LKLALGDLADMLLTDQRVIPAAAEKCGCQFRYRDLEPALEACQPL
jgi:NAD dependent epimerase/dehydratase family enzyme